MNFNPVVLSWLLAIPYLLGGFALIAIAWAAGGWAIALLRRSFSRSMQSVFSFNLPGAGLFLLSVRIAAGMALISWVVSIIGMAGIFRIEIVSPVLIAVILSGLLAGRRFGQLASLERDRSSVIKSFHKASRFEKCLTVMILVSFCGLIINALIGALVPDMNLDPMWYHLPVPQQWAFSGKFDAYPNVMQSSFPLAAEGLFAIIFLASGSPVFCSLLCVLTAICLFFAMASASWACLANYHKNIARGWGVMAVIGLVIPLLAIYNLIAPIQPKNDVFASFWAFTGAMLIWVPLLASGRPANWRCWLLGGFILGTACSAKPPVLCVAFFVMAFTVPLAGWYEFEANGKWARRTFGNACIALAAMGVAAAPWMFRGYLSHGVPLYPVGTSLFSIAPEFQPLNNAQSSIQGVPGFNLSEWLDKLAGFPARLAFGAHRSEILVFVYLVCALFGVLAARGRWRWYSLMLLGQTIFLIGIIGAIEIFRLFAPAYCMVTPLLAWLVARATPRISNSLRYATAIMIIMITFGTYAVRQINIAAYETMQWKFRPVLAGADVRAFAGHAQFGQPYIDFTDVQGVINPDERVLLLGAHFPFYLHRDALWNDGEVGKGGIADRWSHMTADQAIGLLREEEIDVILYTYDDHKTTRPMATMDDLVKNGAIRLALLPERLKNSGWLMYRVLHE